MSTTVPPTRLQSLCGHICGCVFLAAILVFSGWIIYSVSLAFVSPYLPQFEVESASVSQLNINGSSLTATWDISLLARNPNLMFKIYVDSLHPEVQYQYNPDQDIKLGSTQLPAFALKEREADKRLNFKVEVVEESIDDDAVAQRISKDMSRGSLRFGVRYTSSSVSPIDVRFYAFLLPFSYDAVIQEIVCPQLHFKFPAGNNGTGVLTGSQPQCSVLQ